MSPNDPDLTEDCKSEPTSKQKKYMKAIVEGNSKENAKKIAGYSNKTSTEVIERSPKLTELRAELLEKMGECGITSERLARKIKNGLSTKKKQFFSKDGIVVDERTVPDSEIQYKYLRAALEVRNDIRSNAIDQLNIGVISVSSEKADNEWDDVKDASTQSNMNGLPSEKSANENA